MFGKLRGSEILLGAGSVLLYISTFMPWFSLPGVSDLVKLAPSAQAVGGGPDRSIDLNVWDLPLARWWVYLTIFLGLCVLLAALLSRTPDWSMILLTPLLLAVTAATISLLWRLIDSPRPYSTAQSGFYLAIAGVLLVLGGTCWGLRDESVPSGFEKAPRPQLIEVD